ncbi:hypothetical protein P152DRAFT_450742 [Eremomyces bilateralis CBS 781.70]|uniref:Uncharacterized protein n=1 Tax=Eremomyces bilateralis CBS 781.70 TaxID=1392243 RepID=A0A6G1FY35_9PEZI|nr:uncharacterized protein P152DRAFT_450742 [Eremomyces bilateralis CBS 781.70]KAF1810747.1 hypothetical protein P152DRAFT_450742 [Eremomyces bilateralis CBS 781.70]
MVLLTITPATKDALQAYQALGHREDDSDSLKFPVDGDVGQPISHGDVVFLSQSLLKYYSATAPDGDEVERKRHASLYTLNQLLRGARIYEEPPKPKPQPSSEYVKLMARLRREQEAKDYERMTFHPSDPFTKPQFLGTTPRPTDSFSVGNQWVSEPDDVTYADVNRQLALIFNVLISIVACGAAIWVAARHMDVPARLALSMVGAIVVAVAEVVIYSGYIRRIQESKASEAKTKEAKEIYETWVTEPKKEAEKLIRPKEKAGDLRQRKLTSM